MSNENELQDADVDTNESMDDDLSSFVDLTDLEGMDDATNQELFGDLGDIADLGDMPEMSEADSSQESEPDIPLPDISEDDLGLDEEMFHTAEPEEAPVSVDTDVLPEAPASEVSDQNVSLDDTIEDSGIDISALDDSTIDDAGTDIPVLDDSDVDNLGTDIPALDDSNADDLSADIPALDDSNADDLSADIPVLDDSNIDDLSADIPALDDSDIVALDSGLEDDGSMSMDGLDDVMAALDAGSGDAAGDSTDGAAEGTSDDSNIDSMLDGLLDNLDMNGSLDETAASESSPSEQMDGAAALDNMSDILGLDDVPFGTEGQDDAATDNLQDMLDVESMMPQAEETGDEKKPGFFKRVFGNVVTDEIAEQERLEAEKAEEEAAKKAEEDEKAKEEKAEKKAEADAQKAEKKEEKKKQQEAKKAEKAAKKAEKKAKREEEEAAELEVVGKLNKVGVSIIAIATIIFLVVEIAGTNIFGYVSTKNKAKSYFDMGKYTEAYQEAIGTDMRKKNPEEYNKIKVVMKVQQPLNAYQNYDRIGYYPEALNALMKGLKRYDANIDEAIDLDVDKDMMSCRKQILTLLKQEYNLSESEAYAILALDQTAYQKKVVELGLKKK